MNATWRVVALVAGWALCAAAFAQGLAVQPGRSVEVAGWAEGLMSRHYRAQIKEDF